MGGHLLRLLQSPAVLQIVLIPVARKLWQPIAVLIPTCFAWRWVFRQTPAVRIEREQYHLLKAYFSELAVRRSGSTLERMIATLSLEPYAAVYRQLWGLVRAVNESKAAGTS